LPRLTESKPRGNHPRGPNKFATLHMPTHLTDVILVYGTSAYALVPAVFCKE
jgi:hypothetical protein